MVKTEKKSKSGSRKKTSTRILKLVLLLIVVLIVLVFFLVPAFVSSGKGRQIILAKINSSIAGQTDFADLSVGWFKGIRIADFSFNDSLGQISVQVKKITTKPHYASIVMGNLSFGETTIDQPNVSVNLKGQPAAEQKPAGKPEPVPVEAGYIALVMDVAINDGNLKVTDSKARTVELSQINSRLNLREAGRQTDFDINLVVVGQKAERSPIHAAGQIKPGTAKNGWTLKGTTGDLTIEVNNLELESLGPILELAKIEVQAKGSVSADINAVIKDGNFEDLTGSIKAKGLDITGLGLKGDKLKTGLLNVVVKLKSEQQLINIEKLQLDSDWLVAKAGGMVPTTFRSWSDFLTSESDYSLNADFELDVAAILSQMPHTFGIKEATKVTSGKLSGNIKASRGSLTGQANLTELAGIVEDKKLALSEPLIAKLQISADNNKINFDTLDVSFAFAKINASSPLEKLKYDGYVDLEKKPFEPNEVTLTFNAEVNPKQKTVSIKELQLESPQIKIHKGEFNLLNEAGKARLGFEKASYMGLNFGPTDVDIKIQNGLLKIAPFETTVNDGLFNFAGQVDFRQKPALFKIAEPMQIIKDIKIDDQTTGKLLMYLNPIFADAVNVSGIANFSCEQLIIPLSAAAKNQTEVVGTISMDQLRLQASDLLGQILSGASTSSRGTDITIHPTKFVLRDGFLRYDDMQMDIGDNPVNFKGVIGLDKSLNMTITLPYTTRGRTVRLGQETIGQRITLPLKGTIDKPQLDLGRLLESQLKQQLEDQLRKGLEELFK